MGGTLWSSGCLLKGQPDEPSTGQAQRPNPGMPAGQLPTVPEPSLDDGPGTDLPPVAMPTTPGLPVTNTPTVPGTDGNIPTLGNEDAGLGAALAPQQLPGQDAGSEADAAVSGPSPIRPR
jgi:hypothetical protein